MKIIEMTEAIVDDVHKIETSSFSTPWSKKSFFDELTNPPARYFVAVHEGINAGYIGMWEISGQCDITNVAVLPEYRRLGIGKLLINHIIEYCKNNGLSPITLEVRESNLPAISLYKSAGFSEIGFRKKYYSDTGENALIMALDL